MPSVAKYELNADMMRSVTQRTVQESIGIEAEGYRCDGKMLVDVLIKAVKRAYRRRFGIEWSYRQLRRLRIITNSCNPAFRFFVLGFGLLLVTIWAHLRWLFCRVKGSGRPRIDETRMRLQLFISMLRRAVEQLYGVIMTIPTHHSPQSVIY